jgi:hypothetical protein
MDSTYEAARLRGVVMAMEVARFGRAVVSPRGHERAKNTGNIEA